MAVFTFSLGVIAGALIADGITNENRSEVVYGFILAFGGLVLSIYATVIELS